MRPFHARYAQSDALKKQSPAAEWTRNADSSRQLWKWGGDWEGIQARLKSPFLVNLGRRKKIAEVLRQQYIRGNVPMSAALETFEQGAHVVTAGHQLQAGGGPAYFHYKILSAIRWARRITAEGQPAVAVFWLASEDHDFEEIKATHGPGGQSFEWNPEGVEKRGPVGELVWTADAERSWHNWARANHIDNAEWHPGPMPLADRIRKWVVEWFGDLEVLVIDGNAAELKSMAMHLWRAEWEGKGVAPFVKEAAVKFESLFGAPQIQPRDNNLFVLTDNGSRQRADRWQETHGADAWQTLSPEQHSPNVALRPLYQEFLLESVAFVGGPAEVSYWLLLADAFEHHEVHQPALLVRDGALILNAEASQVCEKLDWNPTMMGWRGEDAANEWADQILQLQGDIQVPFDRWSKALENHAKGIHESALPTTRATLAKMEKELKGVKKKWRKIIKQQQHEEAANISAIFDQWISPRGAPQERVLSAMALCSAIGNWSDFAQQWLESLEEVDEPQFMVFR
ncbi:bacillithiol biosynthesis cysteine-adding enzyme BshC [Flavobacteriales bacterium]|nr:bacillithiol biosynthesis cysteine-adding enzyme BshC [Flavobacteriales bacterium]